jgi:antirestriction protein ArdC
MAWKSATRVLTERRDPIQETANRIIEALESGVKPWVRPWDEDKCGGPQAPLNPTTGAHYHGINTLILGMDARAFMTGDPRWMTYLQAQEKGFQVRKGEKSTTIFFTKPYEIDDEKADEGKKTLHFLKHYAVFHASQIDGLPAFRSPTIEEAPWTRADAADIILKGSGAVVRTGGDRAFYSPTTDHIQLPPDNAFRGPPEQAATALHELGHWTGHSSRLNRDLTNRFGSSAYAMEELRAELASAFIANELRIPIDIPNHASYIDNWLKPLKQDKREIFRAAADAQRIANMVLGFHPDFADQPERPTSPALAAPQPVP